MTKMEQLKERLTEDGIVGISSWTFRSYTTPKGKEKKADITVAEYCIMMGNSVECSGEKYAEEILNILDAPSKKVIGECKKCFAFLLEGEDHECNGKGPYILKTPLAPANPIPTPKLVDRVNFEEVIKQAMELNQSIVDGTYYCDNDGQHYMWEEVMKALYGDDYFDWFNANTPD